MEKIIARTALLAVLAVGWSNLREMRQDQS